MELLREIRCFQERHKLLDTQFGRQAINDPNLVRDLKRGRELRAGTRARIRRFMASAG